MRIIILAIGSRGDVQPFIGLGLALRNAGYEVRLATHAVFEGLVRSVGLDFAPLEGNPQAIVQGAEGQAWLESARNPVAFTRGFRQLMGPAIRQAMHDGLVASEGSDAIVVAGPAFYIGFSIAEKLGVPYIQAYAQPIHPTSEFPSALFPTTIDGGRIFNYVTHIAGGQMFWQIMRPVVNDARQAFLGLPPLSLGGPFVQMMRQRRPVLYGYSPAVLPKPKNWGEWMHVVGYWFLDQPGWVAPAALVDFLADGPPPISIGFGSMADRDPARMTEIALDALKHSGRRGILLTGWGGLSQSDLPDGVLKLAEAPHDWLFPRMAAVVHHGGAGTTAAALRAGVPGVVVPFFGDQLFWAQRVHKLGVGVGALQRKHLNADQLASALIQATGDREMRARAAVLGERIRAENGAAAAVEVVNRYLAAPQVAGAAA
jgi:UDP:flavonoid glycosyltransferase YjiC (YdhE family)